MLQYPLRSGSDRGAGLVRGRSQRAAARAARGLVGRPRPVDRRDPPLGDARSPRRQRIVAAAARPATERARVPASLAELLDRFGESTMENWSDDDWEGFTLQALWRVCCDGVRDLPPFTPPPPAPIRHRDLLLEATGADADALVNELLIRFCAAFLDQGFAHWPLAAARRGILPGLLRPLPPAAWTARPLDARPGRGAGPAGRRARRAAGIDPRIARDSSAWPRTSGTTSFPPRCWPCAAGAAWSRKSSSAATAWSIRCRPGSLIEFLAVRLVLDRFALADARAETLGFTRPVERAARRCPAAARTSTGRRASSSGPSWCSSSRRSWALARRAPPADQDDWADLVEEIEASSALERRRIFHLAYEKRFTTQTLDAIALHARQPGGAAGVAAVPGLLAASTSAKNRSAAIWRSWPRTSRRSARPGSTASRCIIAARPTRTSSPLCPVVIRPQHWVTEEVADDAGRGPPPPGADARGRWAPPRTSSTSAAGPSPSGRVLTGAVGVLASFPLVARILFPRLTAQHSRGCSAASCKTPPATRLRLERTEPTPGPENGHVGFTVEEMTAVGERLLRDMGLTSGFARLVLLLGHGSNSLNNPHNSAYNCGACGGSAGGPNARAMAQILNDPRVREGLAERGLVIPAETVFVGGYHNTCNDSVTFFDLDRLPDIAPGRVRAGPRGHRARPASATPTSAAGGSCRPR